MPASGFGLYVKGSDASSNKTDVTLKDVKVRLG